MRTAGSRLPGIGDYILLVEDNPDDEALTLRALGRALAVPIRVEVARDGAEALSVVLAPGARLPRVVLLDLKLPKLSGIDVLRQLRADPRTRLLPVVMLTSSNEDVDIIESYRAGANGYVRKPVDFDEFSRAVGELGNVWVGLNVAPPRP